MQHDQFTVKSREALLEASRIAGANGNPETRPSHILAALLDQRKSVVVNLIRNVGADPLQVRRELQAVLDSFPTSTGRSEPGLARTSRQVADEALTIARELGDSHVACEVLLLAIERVRDRARQVLQDFDLSGPRLQEALTVLRRGRNVEEDAESQ